MNVSFIETLTCQKLPATLVNRLWNNATPSLTVSQIVSHTLSTPSNSSVTLKLNVTVSLISALSDSLIITERLTLVRLICVMLGASLICNVLEIVVIHHHLNLKAL